MDARRKARDRQLSGAKSPAHEHAVAALVHALSDVHLRVIGADHPALEGRESRPVLSPEQLLLHRKPSPGLQQYSTKSLAHLLGTSQAAELDILALATAAHAAAHLLFSEPARAVTGLKPMGIAVVSVIEDARVEDLLCRRFPGVRDWLLPWARTPVAELPASFAARIGSLARALADPEYPTEDAWVSKARHLFHACAAESGFSDYQAFRHIGSILANDLGQLRVRYNAAEYVVPFPYRDDNSYLWSDAQATPVQVQAGGNTPGQQPPVAGDVARASGFDAKPVDRENSTAPERRAEYPEWNYRLGHYRPAWCSIIETGPPTTQDCSSIVRQTGARRRTARQAINVHPRGRLRRQHDGDWLDLEAVIRREIDLYSACPPDDRIYLCRAREPRPVSTLILLDLSASANDIAGTSGVALIETTRGAALALARTLERGGHRTAIHGFRSDTRHRVEYERFLNFGERLEDGARARLLSATGSASTRIGAAIRHAARYLGRETTQHRMLVLLSDGEPADIDVFDPEYLKRDAQRAAQELRRAGFEACCAMPVSSASKTACFVFGASNVLRVHRPEGLAATLSVYMRRRLSG